MKRAENTLLRLFPRSFVRDLDGFQVAGDTSDLIQRYIYMFGVWEPALTAWISRSLKPGDVFVDVGANIGYFSLFASRKVGLTGSVLSVEASPSIFGALQANLDRNQATNVRAVNVAVAGERGMLPVYRAPGDNLGATTTVDYGEPGYSLEAEIEAMPLTDLVTAAPRIVKVDVEGAEWGVVRGMLPLLDLPDLEVIVEVQPEEHAEGRIMRAFTEAGFHPYLVPNDYAVRAYLAHEVPRPERVRRSLTEEVDLIFSRIDAEML